MCAVARKGVVFVPGGRIKSEQIQCDAGYVWTVIVMQNEFGGRRRGVWVASKHFVKCAIVVVKCWIVVLLSHCHHQKNSCVSQVILHNHNQPLLQFVHCRGIRISCARRQVYILLQVLIAIFFVIIIIDFFFVVIIVSLIHFVEVIHLLPFDGL